MPTSVRLDPKSEAIVRRIAHVTGRTKSEVIREAIAGLADEAASGSRRSPSAYDAVADLIGIARGGPRDLARRADEAFRAALGRRAGR